jgi:hypothetical protein
VARRRHRVGGAAEPEKVDHELHSDIVEKHGVNPQELLTKIGL